MHDAEYSMHYECKAARRIRSWLHLNSKLGEQSQIYVQVDESYPRIRCVALLMASNSHNSLRHRLRLEIRSRIAMVTGHLTESGVARNLRTNTPVIPVGISKAALHIILSKYLHIERSYTTMKFSTHLHF